MSRTTWMHVFLAVGLALAALLFIKLHNASGATLSSDSGSAGHRLADAWCKDCHAIEATTAGNADAAPAFIAIANQPFDHGTFIKGVSSDQPPQYAQPRDRA